MTTGWRGWPAPVGWVKRIPAPLICSLGSSQHQGIATPLPPARPDPGAPTTLKRMLSKPGAPVAVLSPEGQPPFFCSQCRPRSPSSTRSTRKRRAPLTAAGTTIATAVSPAGRQAHEPWD